MTMQESTMHRMTSSSFSVRMDVEPKSVVHTSPEMFAEVENMFISR